VDNNPFTMSVLKAIEALQQISSDLVVLPGSTEYDEVTGTYLSTFESQLKPAAFALPSSTQEVKAVLKALTAFGNEIPVAICGAGQHPSAGVANVADGITIHMRRFKGVKLSEDRSFVSIAPGETWGDVYKALDSEGLSVSGGRASSCGIGGLATHGTY
jgi:FAD/FMN-containing dehydrogenase